jgi:hypothetical protein
MFGVGKKAYEGTIDEDLRKGADKPSSSNMDPYAGALAGIENAKDFEAIMRVHDKVGKGKILTPKQKESLFALINKKVEKFKNEQA